MHPSPHPAPVPIRVFTFFVDNTPRSKAFPHGPNTMPGENDWRLNLLFHEWLEHEMPGFFSAHRITHISFVDEMQPGLSRGLPGTKTDGSTSDALHRRLLPTEPPGRWSGGPSAYDAAS